MENKFNKFLTLLTILLFGFGQMWGAINNTTVTKAGGSQKYIDVTTTAASNGDEVTVEKQYIAYTMNELISSAIKDVWYTQSSSGSGSSATDAVAITGYRTACNKYIPISSSKKYTHYVTNCVSFSALYDPRNSGRYCTITATNVDDAEDVLTITNSGSVSSGTKYNVELTGLSASKYYRVVVETNNSSESRIYQIRLGALVNSDGPFAVTYDKNNEGASGTMTDANSPYAKNASVTVLGNSFTAPTGMVFAGWNTKANGTGLSYDPGDSFAATEDVKLYAQWAYPATGTGTITYTLTKAAATVSAAVSGVSTLSSSSTAFSASTLAIGSSNSKDGYSGQITGHAEAYSASQYVALQFTVTDGYTFTPSAVNMKVYANSTSNMKMKLVFTDGTTSVESNELSCSSSADSNIEFASGAFSGKKFVGNVDVILYQWGVTSKRTYVKSPVTITGTVAAACTKPSVPVVTVQDETHNSATVVLDGGNDIGFPAGTVAYKVYVEKKSDHTVIRDWVDCATQEYALSGLSAETTYTVKVKAVGGEGRCATGDASDGVDFTTDLDPAATTYKVTLVPAGGTISDATGWTLNAGNYEKEVSEGTVLTLPTFTKANRTFKTWRKAGPTDVTSPITVTADVTLTAVWNATVEDVLYSWESPEGTPIEVGGTAQSSTDGGSSFDNAQINVAQAGYYCIQLNGKNDYSTNIVEITLSGSEKVKAGDKIRYTGFYNHTDTKNAAPKMRASDGTAIFTGSNLPNINSASPRTDTHTVPEGINTATVQLTRAQTQSSSFLTKLQIIREVLVEEANIRTVTFNYNDGGATANKVVEVASGSKVSAEAAPSYAHHRFHEWKLGGVAYDFTTAVTADITLVADWTQLYTISFANGGGSGDAPAAIADKAKDETFEVPANTYSAPDGKEFDKWNDGSADYAPGATYTVGTANVILTAQWKALTAKYTVHYMDEDGTTPLGADELVEVGQNPAGISATKPLYTFASWQLSGSDIALDDASWASVAANAEVTLTARWAKAYGNNVDFEAYILANTGEKDDADKAEAYVISQNYALSTKTGTTFDANNSTNNGAYAGLKIKNSGTVLSWNVAAGKVVEFKAGVMVANGSLSINGGAAATIDGGSTGSGDNFKNHYFYSAAEALYTFTTSNGSAEVVKAITIRDPYTVSFEAHGDADPSALQGLPSVTLPDASNGTASLLGWFDAETGGNKIGDAGETYIPTANITLHAQWEAVSTDHTLSDLKVGGVTVDGFDPAVNTYYVVLPYGTAVGDIPAISATANSPKAKQVAIQQAVWTGDPYNCYRAQANVQAEDESWGYYDVRFSFAPKDGVSIIKVATTGGTNKTVTGAYAGDGDVNLSSSKKMDGGKYIGFILDGTTLQAGDRINVHTTQASSSGGSHIIFYDNMTDKNELYDTEEIGGTGDNIFTINAAMVGNATAYVYRSDADAVHKWNGYIDYIEVTRAMNPVLTAITIDTRDGVIDPLDDKHFSVTIPYESDLAALTVVPTVIRNAAHPTTPEAVVSNAGAWIIGDNTYRVMDKDGDYTDYTITLDRDVLKHTVSFNTHGGSAVASEEVVHGGYLAAAPADPTKEDYIFQYWSETEDGAEVDVTTVQINADKEFHAVWASDGAIKLLDGSTVNHTNFITAVTADETVEFKGNVVNYAKFSGTVSGVNGVKDLTRVIAYNATTNKTKIRIYAHNNSTSGRNILVKGLVEGADAATDLATIALGNKEDKISDWIEFNNAANRTIYIFVPSSAGDVYFTQVKVIESGETPMKQAGEAGYSLNLNKGRFFGTASTDLEFEGLNARLSGDYTALNSGYAKLTSTSMSFTVASAMTLSVTTNNNKTYYVTKGAAGTDNETAKTGVSEFDLTAGTWYITGGTAEVQITNIAFTAPKCEQPNVTDMSDSELCEGDAFAALNVTASVSDGGTLHYQWYKEAGADDEAVGTDAASYTPTADGQYYVVVTNKLTNYSDNSATSNTITVEHFASAVITTAPLNQRGEVGDVVTLSAAATGKNVAYKWYTCDEDGSNEVALDPAQTGTSIDVTITAGLLQWYKVKVTSDCGGAEAKAKVSEFVPTTPANVTTSILWDWKSTEAGFPTASTTMNFTNTSVEELFADVDAAMPNNQYFRSDMLYGIGQIAWRNTNDGEWGFQGKQIRFKTEVAGKVRVYYRAPSSGQTCTLTIDGKPAGSRTNSWGWSEYVEVDANTTEGIVIAMSNSAGTDQFTRVQKIEFIALAHRRTAGYNVGDLGTVCLEDATFIEGANLYELAGLNENGYLAFDEVLSGELKEGKPYLFEVTNPSKISFYKPVGAAHSDDEIAHKGMIGTFSGTTLYQGEDNLYYFSGRHIWKVNDFTVAIPIPDHRCYVDYDAVQAAGPAHAPVAGRRRVKLGVQGTQVTTDINNVESDDVQCTKVMIDGQLYILRGEKMYDATGRLVK